MRAGITCCTRDSTYSSKTKERPQNGLSFDSFYLSALKIIPLVLGVAHGEGLAGQHAVGDNGLEELVLAHGRELSYIYAYPTPGRDL